MISYFGHTLLHVFNGQPGQEYAGVLNFNSIIKEYDSDWRTALRVVSVNNADDEYHEEEK